MLQLKLFRKQPDTPSGTPEPVGAYHFAGNPRLVGIRFHPTPQNLRALMQQAARHWLTPMLLGMESFLHLIRVADETDLTLTSITIDPPLEQDEEEELVNLIFRVQHGEGVGLLRSYLRRILTERHASIQAISFSVPTNGPRKVKLTVHNNGVLFLDEDDDALAQIDPAVSLLAEFRPGYEQP